MRSFKLPVLLLLGLLTTAFVLGPIVFSGSLPSSARASAPKPAMAAPVTVNLGKTSSSGSTWQAKELLAAISKNTNASKVTITATDLGGQYVELSADFSKDELVRVHPGRTPEVWNGHVISRLRNAADGGSLNSPKT